MARAGTTHFADGHSGANRHCDRRL